MFLTLLAVTLVTSFVVSFFIASLFRKPIAQILAHTVAHESSTAWARFVLFTIFVVGASGGVEIYRLEQYINPRRQEMEPLVRSGPVFHRVRWFLPATYPLVEKGPPVLVGRTLRHEMLC